LKFQLYDDWGQLPPENAALFEAGERQSLFLSRAWFELLTEKGLESGASLCLAAVSEGERLLALLPLQQQDGGMFGSFTHRYSGLYSLLLVDERRDEILACLVDGLKRSGIHRLALEPHDPEDEKLHGLREKLAAQGYDCHGGFRFYNWFHRPEGQSFEEYLAGRPSRLRNTLARKRRKLAREQGFDIRLFTDGDVSQGLADYVSVYNSSWKAREQYPDLLSALVERAAVEGWLRLAVLYVGQAPAAAQVWLVAGGKASIFRLAYDEQWRAYSPGSVLTAWLMQRVIDIDRVEEIDFLTGNEGYKQDWMSERRERRGMSCALPGAVVARRDAFLPALWRKLIGG